MSRAIPTCGAAGMPHKPPPKSTAHAPALALEVLRVGRLGPACLMCPSPTDSRPPLFLFGPRRKRTSSPPSMLPRDQGGKVAAAHIAAAKKGQDGGSYLLGGENKT